MTNVARLDRADHADHGTVASQSASVWGNGHGLTEEQAVFAQLVADGLNHSGAYRRAYDTGEMASNTVWREAHRLSRNEKVATRIAQLVSIREQDDRAWAATRAYRVIAQFEEIMTSGKSDSARLRAAELLGKTVGLFVGEKEPPSTSKTVAELEQELAVLLQRRQ